MGLYNFQKRFEVFIRRGDKTHTIRARRKHPDKPGNTLHLYTGLRTKHAKLIGRFVCTKVEEIEIEMRPAKGNGVLTRGLYFPEVVIDGTELDATEKEAFARRDGFQNFTEMIQFWREPKNRLPFHGNVIHWRRA